MKSWQFAEQDVRSIASLPSLLAKPPATGLHPGQKNTLPLPPVNVGMETGTSLSASWAGLL